MPKYKVEIFPSFMVLDFDANSKEQAIDFAKEELFDTNNLLNIYTDLLNNAEYYAEEM